MSRPPVGDSELTRETRGGRSTSSRQTLAMIDAETQRVFAGFCNRTLPKIEWTHEAHVRVCWATLTDRTVDDSICFLRDGIRAYNVATGVANTPTDGYHETLTVYFVRTIAAIDADTVEQVIDAPDVATTAPLRHWSRELLFGRAARAAWVEPDLAPLPWSTSAGAPGIL